MLPCAQCYPQLQKLPLTAIIRREEDHQASSFHSNLPASQIGKQEPENINIVADSNTSNSHNGPRRPRFASLEDFSSFLAEADPDHRRAQKWSSRRSVVLNSAAVTATSVFLANLIGTVVLNKVYGSSDIFRGDCQKASRLSTGIHVLLNILATLLLGASNLCMQLLIAPTRTEVDRAHQAFTWLDVGIPSFRNLPFVAMRRRAAWWILGFSSLPLHFL